MFSEGEVWGVVRETLLRYTSYIQSRCTRTSRHYDTICIQMPVCVDLNNRPYWGLVERNVFLSFLVATPLFEVTWLQDDPFFAEIDPQLATPPPVHVGGGQGVAVYGERPPTPVDLNDLCPPPEACPECHVPKEAKCNDGGIALFHLVGRMEIKPFANATYPGLPSRVLDCQLYAVGKPVYHRNTEALYGSWMRDPMPVMETQGEKLWVTKENDTYHLFEYSNKTMFRRDIATKRTASELVVVLCHQSALVASMRDDLWTIIRAAYSLPVEAVGDGGL
uniref:Olfactomedin-like domain-containing protein n=1 Tax=Timema bartmani TaxID=61472 RepID=A0A7R9EY56_9NEOP|nr:unnamed protein product [Timema bartmani]